VSLNSIKIISSPTTPLHFFSHHYVQFLSTALHKI
ncbi:hypothetical protein CP10743SC13_1906, partial [Chlamydia psittaci 10_743_SC13]